MTIRLECIAACVLLSVAVHGVNAQAVPVQPQPPEYQTLIDRALIEYEAHNFAEARALFIKAHAIYPNARTLRGLGMAGFELKSYAESITWLEAALAAQVKPLTDELRSETQVLLERAKAFVGRYELEIKPELPSTQILVDGVPVERTPQGLALSVGEHVLQVHAPGYQEETRALSVRGGEVGRIIVDLLLTAAEVKADEIEQRPGPEKKISAGLLLGFGVAIGEDANPWGFGLGVRGGYNLEQIYLGARFVYFLGETYDAITVGGGGAEASFNLWDLGLEGGYDLRLADKFTLRPEVGLGLASVNLSYDSTAGLFDASESDVNLYLAFGATGLYDITPDFFVGLDLRLQLVFADEIVTGHTFLLNGGMRF